jgi:hypothetical protein
VLRLPPGTTRRHIRVEPAGTSWLVEFGLETSPGSFVAWLRSEPVATPPAGPSTDTAVRWMTVTPGAPPLPAERRWNGIRLPRGEPVSATGLPSSHAHPAT